MDYSPVPPVAISGHCSVIYDNVLYVYSPDAFQSLPLKKGGKWSKLQNGISVSGAACVLGNDSGPDTGDALWVVGGASPDKSSKYPGLQKYSFKEGKWQTIMPQVKVTQHRLSHSAVFIPDASAILVYAGSQDSDSFPTTDTFVISTIEPHNVQSFSITNVPANIPVVSPQLLLWDSNSAITLGGAEGDNMIFQFIPGVGWNVLPQQLDPGVKSPEVEQAALIQGADGSKILQLFNLGVSPNKLMEIALLGPGGTPVSPEQPIGSQRTKKRKRDVTLDSWPHYNASNAPVSKRSGFSLAQSEDLITFAGGGVAQQSVALFDVNNNAWLDSSKFFGIKNKPQSISSHTHRTMSSPPEATSEPPAPQGSSDSDHTDISTILGAVLGTILGLIAVLIAVLLYLRYKRRKKRQTTSSNENGNEKNRLSFADRGDDPYMKEMEGPVPYPRAAAHTSVSIINGQVGHRRSDTRGSENSTTHLVPEKYNSAFPANEAMEMGPIKEVPSPSDSSPRHGNSLQVPATRGKRSSGWSRYFTSAEANAAGQNSARSSQANRTTRGSTATRLSGARKSGGSAASTRSSRNTYSDYTPSLHDCNNHGPTEIPPLDMGQQFVGGRVSRVVTGGPPADVGRTVQKQQQRPGGRPRTVSSSFSTVPASTITETIFTTDGHDETTNWTPVTRNEWSPRDRYTSATSYYSDQPAARETGYVPQSGPRINVPSGASKPGASVIPMRPPEGMGPPPMGHPPMGKPVGATTKLVTVPERRPEQAEVQSDMSWIKLGTS